MNHQNVEEEAIPSKKSIANYKFALGVLFHSETISDPGTTEDETANDTDLAHLPMVKSDAETIIPNLAPDLVSDLAPETIDLNTFLDICPNSVSGLVPSAVLDPVPYPYPVPEVPYPIPYVCPNAALGPKEKQPPKWLDYFCFSTDTFIKMSYI